MVTALSGPRGPAAVTAAAPTAADTPVATQDRPAPQEEQVAESAVCALLYGESDTKKVPSASTTSTPLAYHVSDKKVKAMGREVCGVQTPAPRQ